MFALIPRQNTVTPCFVCRLFAICIIDVGRVAIVDDEFNSCNACVCNRVRTTNNGLTIKSATAPVTIADIQ